MNAHEPASTYLDVPGMAWQPTAFPGIEMKVLCGDPTQGAFTALFRVQPGARLPRHRHADIEQTYVLEGSLVDEEGECTAGNFVSAPRRLNPRRP